jgi:D-3-phosphoglycerate dehydrogenase
MAHYLDAFGSNIIAYDPYFKGDPAPAKLVPLETLMKTSDVISIHARLTDENHHMIGERQLSIMKPTAILVNTARSGLVDEKTLIKALQNKSITGAAVDVFDEEPLPANHPFITLENVTITPHLAGSTIDSFKNNPKLMAAQIKNCLSNSADIPVINNIWPSLNVD